MKKHRSTSLLHFSSTITFVLKYQQISPAFIHNGPGFYHPLLSVWDLKGLCWHIKIKRTKRKSIWPLLSRFVLFFYIPISVSSALHFNLNSFTPSFSAEETSLFLLPSHTVSLFLSKRTISPHTHTHIHTSPTASRAQCRSDTQGIPSGRFPYIHLERINKALYRVLHHPCRSSRSRGGEVKSSLGCTEAWELIAALPQ